jgi:type I restriction enzyme M protein
MSRSATHIVQKLWSYCHVLRDDGLSYQDYLEQLTFLLFLEMADEREKLTGERQVIPKGCRWADLIKPDMEGVKLEAHYRETLKKLGEAGGMLGIIFRKSQNKIQDPAKLRQLIVELIGKAQWLSMSADVKGDAYEGLLERDAQDLKSGAGQYFTPPSPDRRQARLHPAPTGRARRRPRLRHGRLPALGVPRHQPAFRARQG